MGFAFGMGPCVGCGNIFSFNPNRVPSIRIMGERQPICYECVQRANPLRKENGLEPIQIFPDSYEPVREEELNW
jgi:hypothetical protein